MMLVAKSKELVTWTRPSTGRKVWFHAVPEFVKSDVTNQIAERAFLHEHGFRNLQVPWVSAIAMSTMAEVERDVSAIATNAAAALGFQVLKEELLCSFLSGNNVFVSLPTGYGKSLLCCPSHLFWSLERRPAIWNINCYSCDTFDSANEGPSFELFLQRSSCWLFPMRAHHSWNQVSAITFIRWFSLALSLFWEVTVGDRCCLESHIDQNWLHFGGWGPLCSEVVNQSFYFVLWPSLS